jgi:hypothetical protein
MAITRQSLGDFFIGQGDMIYWDPIADYSLATLASFKNGKSFGNIKEDSTSWTGEDITETVVRNEQGNVITTTSTAGTLAFEATLADMDNALVKMLMKAKDITVSGLDADWIAQGSTATAVGFGVELPVIEIPVAVTNDAKNKTLIFPKAKVVSALTYEDKMLAIKLSITAQAINTASLTTGMILNGALDYGA